MTLFSRQCSAPSTSSGLTPPVSEASSRRNSGEDKPLSNFGGRKPREKSPCVSFDAEVKYVESAKAQCQNVDLIY